MGRDLIPGEEILEAVERYPAEQGGETHRPVLERSTNFGIASGHLRQGHRAHMLLYEA